MTTPLGELAQPPLPVATPLSAPPLEESAASAFEDMLSRVRDEQQIDLAQFDVNTGTGPGQDGYFDGLIFDSDIISGVGAPLEVLNLAPEVATTPGGGGTMIRAGERLRIPSD